MKKIIKSAFIVLAVAAVAGYGTYSFFSDTETSTGNTFTAGSIDLKIDSEATYNGSPYQAGTWGQEGDGLDIVNQKFFEFTDLKPEDEGENTISLHIDNNPAWVCANINITSDEDVTCTDPENEAEGPGVCSEATGLFNGNIGENLSLAWWADDGDNILEGGETNTLFFQSGLKLNDLLLAGGAENKMLKLTLADASDNFFKNDHDDGDPLDGSQDYFVGLAWCFGDMSINGTTITCDGKNVDNKAQSDSLTANMSFTAVQERNNEDFQCEDTYRDDSGT